MSTKQEKYNQRTKESVNYAQYVKIREDLINKRAMNDF